MQLFPFQSRVAPNVQLVMNFVNSPLKDSSILIQRLFIYLQTEDIHKTHPTVRAKITCLKQGDKNETNENFKLNQGVPGF